MKAMMNSNKKNKNNQPNDLTEKGTSEKARDSFSEALMGTSLDKPSNTAIELGISSENSVLEHTYSDNVLASITEASPVEKPIALPEEDRRILLPEHIGQRGKKSSFSTLIFITAIFLFYLIGYGSYYTSDHAGDGTKKSIADQTNPFSNISLEAKAAYVYDLNSQKTLFALNENDVLPLASLTKLMTAVIASELLPSGTVVTVGKGDIENEGDSGLYINERWKLSDIIGFTLMTSSNDGASALAVTAGSLGQNAYGEPASESKQKFIDAMNKKAEELDLRGTHFFNESGLDVDREISGGYGTARDVAFLMAHIVKIAYRNIESTTLARTTVTSLDNIRHYATNTNEKVNAIPGILASKTGYTDLAGGNLAIAFDAGLSHPIVAVVLGSTREGRFKDAEALAWAALEELKKLP